MGGGRVGDGHEGAGEGSAEDLVAGGSEALEGGEQAVSGAGEGWLAVGRGHGVAVSKKAIPPRLPGVTAAGPFSKNSLLLGGLRAQKSSRPGVSPTGSGGGGSVWTQ